MPAASEAVGAPGGGGDFEQEYEIRNDQGFVYKVPRGLYPDAAPSTTQSAAGPDPKAAGLRRRRRALLCLRDKRLRDLSRWEALASELLAPLPAHQPPASPPASSHPVAAADSSSAPDAAASSSSPPVAAAASSSTSILDVLLVQVDLQTELMKKARQWCDDANAVCDAHEAAIFDSIAPLQLWGRNPSELMAGLCSPAASGNSDEQNGRPEASVVSSAAAKKIPPMPLWGRNPSELMAGLCSPAASAMGAWGFVIRDSDGDIVSAGRGKVKHLLGVFQAKLISCFQGVQEAFRLGIGNLVLETDALQVRQAFYSNDFDASAVGGLVAELKLLMHVNFSCVQCVFVPRECNRVAHEIEASGYECDVGDEQILSCLPECINVIVADDLSAH